MYLKRYFVEGLAHASYLFGANGEAAIVDPKRDVDDYLADAEREGLRIVAILNSHPHADFASGFCELSQRTGAKVYVSHLAPVKYDRVATRDGDRIQVGSVEVELLETPGHSPDSLSFLVRENGRPVAIFTGDLLFVNDVGRPDLRDADEDPSDLASKLYDSLFHKILALPDDVKIYPAHGAGSLCGRAISSAPFSLVGQERQFNWALQIKDRAEFVRQMTANLPDRPAYFSYDVGVNLAGAPALSELPALRPLTEEELSKAAGNGATVIDTRPAPFFGAGHFPGSLNIGLGSALFSTWVGFIVPGGSPIALVLGSADNAAKARLELARIGYDNVLGYTEADSLTRITQLSQLSVCDLKSGLRTGKAPLVLDVRTPGEWEKKHIEGARHIPLPSLAARLTEVPSDQPVALMCGSGYRSSIAASLLQARGFSHLQNVMGGMGAYVGANCPAFDPAELVFQAENI
jgi:glyoxylase-like metal-dependent hydrolase (beta-lactamase superfamily II)/rhodanese-related sulfurtransferase